MTDEYQRETLLTRVSTVKDCIQNIVVQLLSLQFVSEREQEVTFVKLSRLYKIVIHMNGNYEMNYYIRKLDSWLEEDMSGLKWHYKESGINLEPYKEFVYTINNTLDFALQRLLKACEPYRITREY